MFLDGNPLLLAPAIFVFRILDVSMGTVRSILVMRGHRLIAACLGFVEILIWLMAAGQVFAHLDRWYLAVAYAGGFATGNVVGMWVESKLALGWELVRAISKNPEIDLAARLRGWGHDVTEMDGRTAGDVRVEVLLVIEKRRKVPALLQHIAQGDREAIWTRSDLKSLTIKTVPVAEMGTGWRGSRKRK